MNKKIPADAFQYYFALGPGRSYSDVAQHFGVSRRGVAELAQRDRWQEQIETLERNAKSSANRQIQETLEEINARHLKVLRYVLARGLDSLGQAPPPRFGEASRAVLAAIQQERVILCGEEVRPDRSVEELIRREYELCMRVVEEVDVSSAESRADESASTDDGAS